MEREIERGQEGERETERLNQISCRYKKSKRCEGGKGLGVVMGI